MTYVGGNKVFFDCVFSVYRTPSDQPPQLQAQYEDWSADHLTSRLGDTGTLAGAAAEYANSCWRRDVQRATGAADFDAYLSATNLMLSFETWYNFALFDPEQRLLVAVSP